MFVTWSQTSITQTARNTCIQDGENKTKQEQFRTGKVLRRLRVLVHVTEVRYPTIVYWFTNKATTSRQINYRRTTKDRGLSCQ